MIICVLRMKLLDEEIFKKTKKVSKSSFTGSQG